MEANYSILDRLETAMMVLDSELRVHYWNSWAEQYTHVSFEQCSNKTLDELFPDIKVSNLQRKIKTTLTLQVPSFGNPVGGFLQVPLHQLTATSQDFRQQHFTITPFELTKGWVLISLEDRANCPVQTSVSVDPTEANTQAKIDQMTGLPNRIQMLEDMQKSTQPLLTIFSIDMFNDLNKFYGFEISEWMLKEVSGRLKSFFGQQVVGVYKLPSSEYAVLANEFGTLESWALKVEEFLEFSSGNKLVHRDRDQSFPLTFTAGISFQKKGLLRHADLALKAAFDSQKPYLVYDDSMDDLEQFEDNIRWVGVIKDALSQDRIQPYFQPIVSNETGEIEKYETLVRLIDSQGRAITPFHFLEIAKHARLYPQITRRVFAKAFETFLDSDYEFSLNVSVDDLRDKETLAFIRNILTENPKQARQVVFELLESEGIENFDEVLNFIQMVKSFGGKIAIDDFGTGYSNFDYLVKLNIDILKIDGSLIKHIDVDKNSLLVVETLVEFANKFNMKTVAEFVDSNNVLNQVKRLGITYSQGFFLAEPQPDIQSNGREDAQFSNLSLDQLEVFRKLLTTSCDHASRQIEQIIESETSFGIPVIDFLEAHKLPEVLKLRFPSGKHLGLGTQSFVGMLEGETLVLLEPDSVRNVAHFMENPQSATKNEGAQQSTLLELLNILSTAYIKAITERLGLNAKLLAPKLIESAATPQNGFDQKGKVLLIETSVQFKKDQVYGTLLLISRMDTSLLSTLNQHLVKEG